jgi:type IV pilus assembly protein PilV
MKRTEHDSGFTLVEVLIAMFLLVTALLGTAAVTATVIQGNSFSNRMTEATTLAQDKMEELRGMSYDDMTSGSDTCDTLYTRTWTVTTDSPATDTATVEVEVVFPWKGENRTVSVATIRLRPE